MCNQPFKAHCSISIVLSFFVMPCSRVGRIFEAFKHSLCLGSYLAIRREGHIGKALNSVKIAYNGRLPGEY
jgi:hypothetical protein